MTNNRYKEKICPVCSITHKKRNQYCSKECSNKARIVTDETKQKLSVKRREYLQTPEGLATLSRISENNSNPNTVNIDDFAVDIPDIIDLPPGYDIADKW